MIAEYDLITWKFELSLKNDFIKSLNLARTSIRSILFQHFTINVICNKWAWMRDFNLNSNSWPGLFSCCEHGSEDVDNCHKKSKYYQGFVGIAQFSIFFFCFTGNIIFVVCACFVAALEINWNFRKGYKENLAFSEFTFFFLFLCRISLNSHYTHSQNQQKANRDLQYQRHNDETQRCVKCACILIVGNDVLELIGVCSKQRDVHKALSYWPFIMRIVILCGWMILGFRIFVVVWNTFCRSLLKSRHLDQSHLFCSTFLLWCELSEFLFCLNKLVSMLSNWEVLSVLTAISFR